MDENVTGVGISTVSATDPEGGAITYQVDDSRFEVVLGNLRLKSGQSLDHEGDDPVTLTITAEDAGGNVSAPTTVTVQVNDADEAPSAPVVANAASLSVDENDAGATISTVTATDPEGGSVTYQVSDSRFEVTSGGDLKLVAGQSLDHEAESSVTLAITARDAAGNSSASTSVTVQVNDVNEPPVAVGTVDDVIAYAGVTTTMTVNLGALFTDPDGDTISSYVLSGAPAWASLGVQFLSGGVEGTITADPPAGTVGVFQASIVASRRECDWRRSL